MQALILAGGEGTRLRPLTTTVPKPVLPLANRPFISYMIDWLSMHGVDDVVLSCGFLADQVRAVLGDTLDGARLRYIEEEEPLGTAGAVKFAEPLLNERFLVLNGDVLTDFDLSALQRFHDERNATATIALVPVDDPTAYGLVRAEEDGRIKQFLEKPRPEEIDTNLINAGAYVLEHAVLEGIPAGRPVSFEREVFPGLVGSGLYGHEVSGYWLDIGTPERYLQGTCDILEGTVETVVTASQRNGAQSVGRGTAVSPDAQLIGKVLIGDRCAVEAGARLGPLAVVGDGSRVGPSATIERAVLHQDVEVQQGAVVRESIVGHDARVGADSRLEDGTVVGPDAVVGSGSVLQGERVDADAGLVT
jgi:mannose-1-phosphate guanylyltransferase